MILLEEVSCLTIALFYHSGRTFEFYFTSILRYFVLGLCITVGKGGFVYFGEGHQQKKTQTGLTIKF